MDAVSLPRTGAGWRPPALRAGLLFASAVVGGILLILVFYPSAVLVLQSFVVEGRLSPGHCLRIARDAATYQVLANSLVVSTWATAGGTALGVILAWLISRTDLPGRRLWRTILLLPYMIPPFIRAIAWVYLLSPVGYANQAWMALTGSPDPLFVIYGRTGIILVLILS